MSDVRDERTDQRSRQMPPWLLGLIIAVVIFLIGFLVFQALGFGDDPVIDSAVFPDAVGATYGGLAAKTAYTVVVEG